LGTELVGRLKLVGKWVMVALR